MIIMLVEGSGVSREIVNRLGEELGIRGSLTCLLHWLTLTMRVILRVMTRVRMGTVMMSGDQLSMLGQGFRGVQLSMNVMGLVGGLLEEEVMKPLYRLGYFPTSRGTTSNLYSGSK